MKKYFLLLFWILSIISWNINAEIIKTKNIKKIRNIISQNSGAIIFIDLDDTIITPCANMFRSNSKHRYFIDALKKNGHIGDNEKKVSIWRTKRKAKLVSYEWPDIISESIRNGNLVYGLTQTDPGKYGIIENMEKLRYNEVSSFDIKFTPDFLGKEASLILKKRRKTDLDWSSSDAVFYKGIFLTGMFTKAEIVKIVIKDTDSTNIIFVDDREDHVRKFDEMCRETGKICYSILYRGVDKLKGKVDDNLAIFQKKQLLENYIWLEDKEANKKLNGCSCL